MDEPTRGIGNEARRAEAARGTSSAANRTTKGKRPASQTTDLDPETETRTRVIREEIADTRAELAETVEAIQEKLRPSNIVSESKDAVKNAVTERVGFMADSASRTAQDFIEDTRQNPMPALMIGAGVAWLLYDRTRSRSPLDQYVAGRGSRRSTRTRHAYDDAERALKYGTSGITGERTHASGYGESYSSRHSADGRNGSVRRMTRDAQTALQRMLHENPLLVAAAAVLAGAAIGGALPQTDTENDLMGETRDQFVDRGKEAARDAVENVREVAHAVQDVTSRVTGNSTE